MKNAQDPTAFIMNHTQSELSDCLLRPFIAFRYESILCRKFFTKFFVKNSECKKSEMYQKNEFSIGGI